MAPMVDLSTYNYKYLNLKDYVKQVEEVFESENVQSSTKISRMISDKKY